MKGPESSSPHPPPDLARALDRLWERFLPEICERAGILERAAASAAAGTLSAEQVQQAHEAAHKLAGVLGTFGLARGTDLARELENLYTPSISLHAAPARLSEVTAELCVVIESRK